MTTTHRLTRAAQLEALQDFRDFIQEHCAVLPGADDGLIYDVQLAVDEACTNIISHGYAGLEPGSIILDLEAESDRLILTLTDFGHSFEPGSAPVPDVDAPIEERELGGFGLFFIQQTMDDLEYHVTEDGNKMILTKYFNQPDGGTR